MKLNDKIEFIKNEVKSEIPTINAKDLFKKVNTNYVSFSSNPYKNNKLLFKPYIKFTFLIIIIISIIIGYNGLNIHIEQDNKQFNRNLGFASVSLVSLFNNSNNTNEIKINDKIEFVNMHMYSIELIIDNNFYYIESDNINYKNLIIYNYENIKYKIYYNIVKTSKNRYDLEILTSYNDNIFNIQGILENKKNTLVLELKLNYNDNEWIKVINIDNEFNYEIYKNNITLLKSKIIINNNFVNLSHSISNNNNLIFSISKDRSNDHLYIINYHIDANNNSIPEQDSIDDNNNNDNLDYSGNITVSIKSKNQQDFYSYLYSDNNNMITIYKNRIK